MQYTVGKIFSRPFQRYTTSPQIPKILVSAPKKTILQSFNNYKAVHDGQKNRNGKMTAILFRNIFY